MKKKAAISITRSSGNVFADLGFDNAAAQVMAMRADLMIALEKAIKDQQLTQAAAATILGVSQARVSDLIRHKADKFSLDMLVAFAAKLGHPAQLSVAKRRRTTPAAALVRNRADMAAGRYVKESVQAHVKRLAKMP